MGWMRKPQTTGERREGAGLAVDEDAAEHGVKVRDKRKPDALPNAWDDVNRERQRSWKVNRQRQAR